MTNPAPRRRGRPRSFDRNEALRKAMQTFWTNGYEGTSMTQLVDAMGIVSPSIYAAFGSKEELFREAVDLYIHSEAEAAWKALDQIDDTRTAIQTMLLTSIDSFVATQPPRGCLVILGTSHLGNTDEVVQTILRTHRNRFRKRLTERLTRQTESHDAPDQPPPEALSECILAFFSGLAIEAVDGVPEAQLRETAKLFCKQLL